MDEVATRLICSSRSMPEWHWPSSPAVERWPRTETGGIPFACQSHPRNWCSQSGRRCVVVSLRCLWAQFGNCRACTGSVILDCGPILAWFTDDGDGSSLLELKSERCVLPFSRPTMSRFVRLDEWTKSSSSFNVRSSDAIIVFLVLVLQNVNFSISACVFYNYPFWYSLNFLTYNWVVISKVVFEW